MTVALAAGLLVTGAREAASSWPEANGAAAQAEALRERVLPLAYADAAAYAQALAALRESAEAEADPRDDRLVDALDRAADVPLAIAEAAVDVAVLAAVVAEHGDHAVCGDAAAAAMLADGAARAVANLVEINLATIEDDARVRRARRLTSAASTAAAAALDARP